MAPSTLNYGNPEGLRNVGKGFVDGEDGDRGEGGDRGVHKGRKGQPEKGSSSGPRSTASGP